MKMSDHCEEICVKALISKNNSTCKKRRFTDTVWKLNAPGDGLLMPVNSHRGKARSG